ncbi:MAG: HAD family hydrolase [Anaerolineales bacterium]|nr:MAG: HAD family hydrolase [Anaerolineales bacterium]
MSARIRAVVFDLDGLMVDSESLAKWAWDEVLARYGHEWDDGMYTEVLGMRVADCAAYLATRFALPAGPAELLAEREALFLDAVPQRLQAMPGLYPLLDELRARDLPFGLATSGHRRYVRLALTAVGLEGCFEAVAAGDDVQRGKPAPDVYLLAAHRLQVPPTDCLALEDTPLGAASAVSAGMVCVAVPNEWTASLDFPGTHSVLASLDEVRETLDELLSASARPVPKDQTARHYAAAGGVVVRNDQVLVLLRRSRDEARLPKGHIDPGETAAEAALRETTEESGHSGLAVRADLGAQVVKFESEGQQVVRWERYFLLELTDPGGKPGLSPEEQFNPVWLGWDEALETLSYEAEREWVRRARALWDR